MNKEYCNQDSIKPTDLIMTRREYLKRFGMGMGTLSLASLLPNSASAQVQQPHFKSKVKRVIHVFFSGGQSHIDTWDPKSKLVEMDGQALPTGGLACGSPFKFNKYGKSGLEISEVFDKVAKHADDMVIINSLTAPAPAHEIATVMMNTGSLRFVRPSIGSWVVYGLGSANDNLPSFISLRSGGMPLGGTQNFGSAFLPGMYQGTPIDTSLGSVDRMIQNISNKYSSKDEQQKQMELLTKINEIHKQNLKKDEALDSRIKSFELAFRMQTEATDAFDISKEPQNVRDTYGSTAQGKQMLIARRLAEKGVRFIQVWTGGWDTHNALSTSVRGAANQIDGPLAALIQDLKNRNMLDETLIVCVGEFGRTPSRDGEGGMAGYGRSHHSRAMSAVLIGGGVKGGTVYGKSDEFGYNVVEDKMDIHDLHGSILYALGFDHRRLGYMYSGREFRLTDVSMREPIKALFA